MGADSFRLVVHQGINKGGFEAFKKMAQDMTMGVEANEPNTLCYEWYVSDDGTDCYLVESYTDSEALLEHLSHVGEALHKMLDVSPLMELLVLGTPNKEVREALAGMGAKFFPLLIGCTR